MSHFNVYCLLCDDLNADIFYVSELTATLFDGKSYFLNQIYETAFASCVIGVVTLNGVDVVMMLTQSYPIQHFFKAPLMQLKVFHIGYTDRKMTVIDKKMND